MCRRLRSQARRTAAGLLLLAAAARADAQFPRQEPAAPASAAARLPAPPGAQLYAPGVYIDWPAARVLVDAVCLEPRQPLEFFACFPGKSHESLLLLNATAGHVYEALGLTGFERGHPPQWDADGRPAAPATGALIAVGVEWLVDGRWQSADGFDWLLDLETEQPVLPRPWVFSGSLRRSDGTLAADITGEGFALVDMPGALGSLSRRRPSMDADLWASARRGSVPAAGTPVRLVLSQPVSRAHAIVLDAFGDLRVDGAYCDPQDVIDLIGLQCRLAPANLLSIRVESTLRTDVLALQARIRSAGLADDAVRFDPATGATATSRPAPLSRP